MNLVRLATILTISILSIFFNIQSATAQESGEDLERQVKSAFIFKFGNYVTWPETTFGEASSPIIIGIVDNESVAAELEKIATGHTAGNRPVVVKRLNGNDQISEVHILYIANDPAKYISKYKDVLQQPSTLYITDIVEGLSSGSVINFVRDENRIRFDVSLPAAEKSKIKLGGSLLTVARHVVMQ